MISDCGLRISDLGLRISDLKLKSLIILYSARALARMLHELPWRDREDGRATG
jgi:hypothetical protein